jgi:hypothetical protein
MPRVSEWVRNSDGTYTNKNYYVPPASGEAGGEDYKKSVTVHNYVDANTGQNVKVAQHSATVSYEEGKVIEQALNKQEELVKQGLVNVQIEQSKNDKGEVVGLQVAADYPKKTIGRGQWTQMSDTERESYLKANPNLYVLTPEGEIPAVISEGESSYFNPKGFTPQESKSNSSMVSEAEYNKLKAMRMSIRSLLRRKFSTISKYNPGYAYERPLTEDSLLRRSSAESVLKSTISEKYKAKSLMQQYEVLGVMRFFIDVGEGF